MEGAVFRLRGGRGGDFFSLGREGFVGRGGRSLEKEGGVREGGGFSLGRGGRRGDACAWMLLLPSVLVA